jgi:hypothetical protein
LGFLRNFRKTAQKIKITQLAKNRPIGEKSPNWQKIAQSGHTLA